VAEFVSKMSSSLQELEETGYWLELLADANVVSPARLVRLRAEVDELTRILVASINTARKRARRP
jgi:four helix bundle protein